jgi:hypothetical protein
MSPKLKKEKRAKDGGAKDGGVKKGRAKKEEAKTDVWVSFYYYSSVYWLPSFNITPPFPPLTLYSVPWSSSYRTARRS